MEETLEHIRLVGELKQNKINLDFIKNFNIKTLFECCNNLKNKKVSSELYSKINDIQFELIRDKDFADYLIKMNNTYMIDLDKIEDLVKIIQENNKKVTDYKLDNIVEVLNNDNFEKNTYIDYLEYFSDNVKKLKEQNILSNNLKYFKNQNIVSMLDLNEEERKLFLLEFMGNCNLIPIRNIKRVCELLVQDNELKIFINFLFLNKLDIELNINDYEIIHQNSKIICEYIHKIFRIINNNDQMYKMLINWVENGCAIYDLKILERKLNDLDINEINKIFCCRSSYINFIFGSKLSKFPLDRVSSKREKLIIYAISNNKKNFLKLIDEKSEEFFDIDIDSILFDEKFYKKYININILTFKNLIDLKDMSIYKSNIQNLKDNYYTFEEIKLLYNVDKIYLKIYNELLELKLDKRILIIKQLLKREVLKYKDISDEQLIKLTDKLKEKNLYSWIENDLFHIDNLELESVIDIFINYDFIKKFIPQISNQNELSYIIRNLEEVQKYNNILEIKENIEDIDKYWKELICKMNFSEEFIEQNKENIKKFLLNNETEIALSYYKNCNEEEKESFKRIVKSEIMGKFKILKYYTNDLEKEIDFNLKDYQIKEWINNFEIREDDIEVKEYDDFYNTMLVGEIPQRTCLSYKTGMYKKCLLANFDSNKKILYAKLNGKIVARAMIRLTKGTYSNTKENSKNKISFVDLEEAPKDIENKEKIENEEILTLFLEKIYTSKISLKEEQKIKNMFIKLLQHKAIKMNALLVLSNCYSDIDNKDYVITQYYMYISRSKAGSQYLDSLGGQAQISEEGQYHKNKFLVRND